jgi:hypothetical protein
MCWLPYFVVVITGAVPELAHGSELVFSELVRPLVDQAVDDLPARDPAGHVDRLAGFM